MEATTSKEGGLNERGPKAIAHEMGLQVSHGVHSEVGGIQCGGIHQGEECNLDCPELSGTETPFDREEFLSARLFRFHGGDGQTIRAGIHLAAGAGGAAFGGAEHGVGASAAFRRLLTGPFEGLTEISPRLCRGSFNWDLKGSSEENRPILPIRRVQSCTDTRNWPCIGSAWLRFSGLCPFDLPVHPS